MKVVLVHARYALTGGEERLVDTQADVLRALGHTVVRYEEDNAGIGASSSAKVRAAATSVWSRRARRNVAALIASERPDVVHVHNAFPRVTPSVYAAANDAGVPVVQHLHNARLVCIQPFLVRDGEPCFSCVGRAPLPGVIHRCYRGSLPESAAAAGVLIAHRTVGTWRRRVARFVAVSESLADTYRASGVVPANKLVVCENGLDVDPGQRRGDEELGYALFVGRLSAEKGADTLVDAARSLPDLRVVIAGDGPERAVLERRAGGSRNIEFVGRVDRDRVFTLLRGARVLVAPARGQEPFGISVVEAAAVGVPTIATRVGALATVVRDGVSGVLVEPNDAAALAAALRRLRDGDDAVVLGRGARAEFESRFSPAAFGNRLVALYDGLLPQAP